jgi:Ca2+/Na+ antiporter
VACQYISAQTLLLILIGLVFLVFPPSHRLVENLALDIALFRKTPSVWVAVILANNLPNTIERLAIKALVLRCALALYLFYQFD